MNQEWLTSKKKQKPDIMWVLIKEYITRILFKGIGPKCDETPHQMCRKYKGISLSAKRVYNPQNPACGKFSISNDLGSSTDKLSGKEEDERTYTF